jgi:hypothetical protein
VIGRRLKDGDESFAPGDYGKVRGVWHARPPKGNLGGLANHTVTEHEDGTITVSPSILITSHKSGTAGETTVWHGFLERGVWREA